jgi:hypothetical protein
VCLPGFSPGAHSLQANPFLQFWELMHGVVPVRAPHCDASYGQGVHLAIATSMSWASSLEHTWQRMPWCAEHCSVLG